VITNSATVYEARFECGGESPSSGDWRFEAVSPESVKGNGKFTMEKISSTGSMTAKWVSASCGDVK
jgi:hypothetical protein